MSANLEPDMGWEETYRFDQWIRDNTGQLRKHVADVRDKYPKARNVKGIEIVSTLYRRNGGAPLA